MRVSLVFKYIYALPQIYSSLSHPNYFIVSPVDIKTVEGYTYI